MMIYMGIVLLIIGFILFMLPFITNKWEPLIKIGFLIIVLAMGLTIIGALIMYMNSN